MQPEPGAVSTHVPVEHSRSRRAILGAGTAAVAAIVAGAVKPLSALAANGDPIKIGQTNAGTATTQLTNTGQGPAFRSRAQVLEGVLGETDNAGGGVAGVRGLGQDRGVIGDTKAGGIGVQGSVAGKGTGVLGYGHGGPVSGPAPLGHAGVYGNNDIGAGVIGESGVYDPSTSNEPGYIGVFGLSYARLGVYGASGQDAPSVVPFNTGVYGWSDPGRAGAGVRGNNDHADGNGVVGTSSKGVGVAGFTINGTGVRAAVKKGTGLALVVSGRNAFSAVGSAAFGVGDLTQTVPCPVPVNAASRVLATLDDDAGSGIGVAWARGLVRSQEIQISLTAHATQAASVTFFVLEPD